MEYSIRRHMMKRLKENHGIGWQSLTPELLRMMNESYFEKFITDLEVTEMDDLLNTILEKVGDGDNEISTEQQARAAYSCFTVCKAVGIHKAKAQYSTATWYRHMKNLRKVGINEADLQPSNVIPLRKKQLFIMQPVSCWDDIKTSA